MRLRVLASSTARPQTGQPDGRLRTRRHSRPVLPARARREPHPAACRAVGYRGRPVHLMHDRATATFDAYRDNVIPTAANFEPLAAPRLPRSAKPALLCTTSETRTTTG
jgi:hypothetical protein